jgi:hypothetical protein
MIKPVVYFEGVPVFQAVDVSLYGDEYAAYMDKDGCAKRAVVFGIDHPKIGTGVIRTSVVINIFNDGSFETMNTVYVPLKEQA